MSNAMRQREMNTLTSPRWVPVCVSVLMLYCFIHLAFQLLIIDSVKEIQ